jgi:hypothetical protein
MAQTWPNHGPNMVQTWSKHGPNMAQTWPNYGPNRVQTWLKCGPTMIQNTCARAHPRALPRVLPRTPDRTLAHAHTPAWGRGDLRMLVAPHYIIPLTRLMGSCHVYVYICGNLMSGYRWLQLLLHGTIRPGRSGNLVHNTPTKTYTNMEICILHMQWTSQLYLKSPKIMQINA